MSARDKQEQSTFWRGYSSSTFVEEFAKAFAKIRPSAFNCGCLLYAAAVDGNSEQAQMVLRTAAGLKKVGFVNDMFKQAYNQTEVGQQKSTQQFLREQRDTFYAVQDGASPLFVASRDGHASIVTRLLVAGALVNQVGSYAATPLVIASRNGHVDIVTQLLAKGAWVDQERMIDGVANTPLYIALRQGHIEIARILLENGADEKFTRTLIKGSSQDKSKLFKCLRKAKKGTNKDLILLRKRLPEYKEKLSGTGAEGDESAKYKNKIDVCEKFISLFTATRQFDVSSEKYVEAVRNLSDYLKRHDVVEWLAQWKGSDLNKVAKNLMKLVDKSYVEVEEKTATATASDSSGGGGSKEGASRAESTLEVRSTSPSSIFTEGRGSGTPPPKQEDQPFEKHFEKHKDFYSL